MRVAIASRIFEPEPSAASFRLAALADAFARHGHDVEVLTVHPPRQGHDAARPDGADKIGDRSRAYRVRRFPVLRDRSGYVRGYVPYLTFDLPLCLRILFGRRRDAIIAEPPPTTGFFVRIAAALRRTPYVYYAADVWSDAASQTGAHRAVVRILGIVERIAWRGARVIISVSPEVTDRLRVLEPRVRPVTVGNGVDVARFQQRLETAPDAAAPDAAPGFVYAGTASEWHGAEILIDGYARAAEQLSGVPLTFIGGGAERERLERRAAELGIAGSVRFSGALPAEELGPVLAGSVAALATLRPGAGYDFAFPTKLWSATACGAPLIHVGPGPAVPFVETELDGEALGETVPYDATAVAEALIRAAQRFTAAGSRPERRSAVRAWAVDHVSLTAVADTVVASVTAELTR